MAHEYDYSNHEEQVIHNIGIENEIKKVKGLPIAKYDFEKNAPSDLKKAFEARYLLVTQKNIKEIAKKYPALFK